MKRSNAHGLVGLAVLVHLVLGMTGCNSERYPAYSANVKYGVRTDPIVRVVKELGEDRYEPDRPGLMPIMKIDDMLRPDHPYNPKMISGNEQNLRKVAYRVAEKELPIKKDATEDDRKRIEEQRKKRQEELLPNVRGNPGAYRREFAEVLDKELRFPALLSDAHKIVVEQALETMFGTPAKPIVNAKEAGIDEKFITDFKLDDKTLAAGSSYYRVHCLHCHGVPGNGRGPTARWVNPHPRDFRAGTFKFQSVDRATGGEDWRPPTRADLLRTLQHGIEGTAMPSFNLLPEPELEALISYVIHLSLRGNVEMKVILECFAPEEDPAKPDALMLEKGQDIKKSTVFWAGKLFVGNWVESAKPSAAIKVAPYPFSESDPDYMTKILPESVKRGQQIFTGTPSEETKWYFVKPVFAKQVEKAKKDDLDRRLADFEADAIDKHPAVKSADAKALADAEAKEKRKLTDDEISEIKEKVRKDLAETIKKDIDFAVQKATPKLVQASKLEHDKIEIDTKASLMEKAKGSFGLNCYTCHVNYGRQAQFKYDNWGTLVRPNNFTLGVFRGGKRPVDVYYRIHSGIPGTVMTSFGKAQPPFDGNPQYIWDLVNFVTVLSYPNMREKLGVRID